MKRLTILWLGVLVTVAAAIAPAGADELSDLIEGAAEADYAGRRIVVTFIDGTTAFDIVDVEHAGSLMMVEDDGAAAVVGAGRLSAGDGGGLAISSWNSSQMSDRYSVTAAVEVRRLNRAASSIQVLEDGKARMNLIFDNVTGTPLVTEVYDGAGKLFRLTAMLDMDPIPARLYSAQVKYSDEYDVLVPVARHSLPAEAAGYKLADAYSGPGESIQGFYSDGLFSYSLFVVDGAAESDRFDSATTVKVDGRDYRRIVDPAEMWITWRSGDHTYVLVGDLPPDHLESVLAALPRPASRNLFSRLWNGIFG